MAREDSKFTRAAICKIRIQENSICACTSFQQHAEQWVLRHNIQFKGYTKETLQERIGMYVNLLTSYAR
jgi:hypothetical protein